MNIYTWGWERDGQGEAPGGDKWVGISAGMYHGLALDGDGSTTAWGRNAHGQLDVPENSGFHAVVCGLYHSLGLKADGSVAAWGWNRDGPCDVPVDGHFVSIAAGAAITTWPWTVAGRSPHGAGTGTDSATRPGRQRIQGDRSGRLA